MAMNGHHFLLVSFPFQSHLNPTLRLATKLTRAGVQVTFVTTATGLNILKTRPNLSCDSFSDGHDDDGTAVGKPGYFQKTKLLSSINFKNLLLTKAKEGQKVDFIIYGICLPWVAEVAHELHVPSAFFFFQSAASFSVVYQFFRSDGGVGQYDTGTLQIPGLPLLTYDEIPEFLLQPKNASYTDIAPIFKEHIQVLENHPNPCVLINTFDDLEQESIKTIPNITIFSVGPLIPGGATFICDIYHDSDRETYLRWLDSKPEKSVVYVSFGSIAEFEKKQKEEILEGLLESGRPFLWVIRSQEVVERYDGGLIVRWCSQVEVLNHFAIGCFVTHCGWNSILESMVGGVAVVGCPQFSEQKMNAKMVEEVWRNGVKAVADGEGVVARVEIKRCLDMVMGVGEIRRNCERLKAMAAEAVVVGGTSNGNLNHFLETSKFLSHKTDPNGTSENGSDSSHLII